MPRVCKKKSEKALMRHKKLYLLAHHSLYLQFILKAASLVDLNVIHENTRLKYNLIYFPKINYIWSLSCLNQEEPRSGNHEMI